MISGYSSSSSPPSPPLFFFFSLIKCGGGGCGEGKIKNRGNNLIVEEQEGKEYCGMPAITNCNDHIA